MPYAINGQPLQRARVTVPRLGIWTAEAAAAGPLTLADGAAVELVIGDTTFVGHVVPGLGGAFVSECVYTIAGGAGGWAKPVPQKVYRDESGTGVRLATVAAQLAAAAGEHVDLGGVDRVLGGAWTRPAGLASVALDALFPLDAGGWRVDPDGITRPGVRPPTPLPPAVGLAVEDYQPARRWARVGLEQDRVSALLPGAILMAPNLAAPLVVGTTTIHAAADAVNVEVLGEGGLVELFVALVAALTAAHRFFGVWTYQVELEANGRASLRALASTAGLPDQIHLDKVPGVAGATFQLAPQALVLVAFQDGSPGAPVIVGCLPGVAPVKVGLDATTEIRLGGVAAGALAKAGITDFNFGALAGKVNAICTALSIPPLGGLNATGTAKVLGE